MPQLFSLVIAGGSNLVAPYLISRLQAQGLVAEIISRQSVEVPAGFKFTQMDLNMARNWIAPEGAVIVSLLPLALLAQFLPRFIGVKSIIAVSARTRFSEVKGGSKKEGASIAQHEKAENFLQEWGLRCNVHATLLRPTMVYDGKKDQNVTRMAAFIRKWHFLPIANQAKGLRQPIHADDVAKAIINSFDNAGVYGKTLNIAGGEILTYRDIIRRIFEVMGMSPHLMPLPIEWLTRILQLGAQVGIVDGAALNVSTFLRMNQDLIFDVEEGLQLLDYQPRPFKPEIQY